jgi:phosphohistidine phosphatase
MKKLILMRHAKSGWDNPDQKDFNRELNKRGIRNAPEMGLRLKEKNWPVDLVVSSLATRAKHTAQLVCAAYGYPEKEIDYRIDVYEAQINDLKQVLQSIEDTASSVLLIGHNPGMSYFADYLANCGHINLPTAGMIYMHLDIKTWKELKPGCGKLVEFDFPKRDPFDTD